MIKIFVFLASIFLLFYNLNAPFLWQDEGEVVMIARNITKYGLPVAYDGDFLVTQTEGQDSRYFGDQRLWTWNTWLPYYATAISFKFFGEGTAQARFPFALAGIGTLVFTYLLARKMKLSLLICLLILATNTMFCLYNRQARYYSFNMFFPLAATYFFISKKYFWYFLSLLASFHSNFVLAFGFNLPVIILGLKNKWTWIFLGQSLLWLTVFHPAATGGQLGFLRYWQGGVGELGVLGKLGGYLNLINSFYFPLILGGGLIFWRKFSPFTKVLILESVTHLIIISLFLQFGQRYLVTLIPVFCLLVGAFLSYLQQKKIILFLVLLPIFLFTNIPNIVSERVFHPKQILQPVNIRFLLKDYIVSLFQNYPGPLEGISDYLRQEKIADEIVVYTDYEINSLKFYFPRVRWTDKPTLDAKYFIQRSSWGNLNGYSDCQKELIKKFTQETVLPNFDTQWESMPDITYHQFTIDKNTPRVVIYKVRNPINWQLCP